MPGKYVDYARSLSFAIRMAERYDIKLNSCFSERSRASGIVVKDVICVQKAGYLVLLLSTLLLFSGI